MKPADIVQRLEQTITVTGSPRRLREAIEIELTAVFGMAPIAAAESAEALEPDIAKLIMTYEEEHANPTLTIIDVSPVSVVGTCYVSPLDTAAIALAKQQRLHIDKLLNEIRALSFQEFEIFGGCVLRELGATQVTVTPHASDQGIDFYGVLSLGDHSYLPSPFGKLAHDVKLRFAGQAKHYPTDPIGPEMIRELVGSVSLARYKVTSSTTDLFEDLDLLPLNPLVSLFFTTGKFTSGALELAKKAGIIARSGEQLAAFLADKGVGMPKVKGKPTFNRRAFRHWLQTPVTSSATK